MAAGVFSWVLILFILKCNWESQAATNFCIQPLGMERRIIEDAQITNSTTLNAATHSGKEARLNNNRCWCSAASAQFNQWLKVDLEKPLQITGIAIQGDPNYPVNYIAKFKLRYSTNGNIYSFTRDVLASDKEYVGATGQNQLIKRSFESKPFAARYVEFQATQRAPAGLTCVRFELYGCSYVCNQGLGVEYGLSLPLSVLLSASSSKTGYLAIEGRLSGPSCWCANTSAAKEYIHIDFGTTVTITGIAVQGNPTTQSWVKDFYMDYGLTVSSITTYTEKSVSKLFVGNKDQNTTVINWFKNRLRAKFVRVKPNTYHGDKCMRIEIIGCNSDFIAEVGAENRVLDDNKFYAYASTQWAPGRYYPKDGRLNNDRPWGSSSTTNNGQFWFKVDLGRVMLVNGIATQGDPIYGENFFPDYKLEFILEGSGTNNVTVKKEGSSVVKVFSGNTNNMGVKFNLLENSPISARYIQFLGNTKQPHSDYTLRVEIYARPQVCSTSFGMVAGESSAYAPTISVSGGTVPSSKAKINSQAAWCSGSNGPGDFFMYDLGEDKQLSGIAIQGNPSEDKWVKTFKVQYGSTLSSLTTFSNGSGVKEFVGCSSRDLVVYNWFPTEITTRYLKIMPITSQTEACLRLNVFGCPWSGCFKRIGMESSAIIANSLLSSSTFNNGNEAYKGRFNSYTTWAACQVGSCSPKESSSSKPWIQLCLTSANTISAFIIQGHGDQDSLTDATSFTFQYSYTASGTLYNYKYLGAYWIFVIPTGRYRSHQINFRVAFVAKCIRVNIKSQLRGGYNVGLRWEVLGCNSVKKVSLSLSSSSITIKRGNSSAVTCTGRGQSGGIISFKTSAATLVNSDVYNLGYHIHGSLDTINVEIRRQIEITAKGPSIASSYSSCSVMDAAQGLAQCQQTIECSLVYAGIPALGDSKSFNVTVIGLIGRPQAPTRIQTSNITPTSAKITWNASIPGDFNVENYKISIKKKSDGLFAIPNQRTATYEVTFKNLMAFTQYTVEISAKAVTLNLYSAVAAHNFTTDEGAATAPINVTATLITDTRISLEWKQPILLNGNLHQYLIKYRRSTDLPFLPVVNAGKTPSTSFENLDLFTEYQFQVAATTKRGAITGDWSSLIGVKTKNVWLTVSGNLTIKEGENATLTCNITASYPVTWMDELNNTIPSSNGILILNSVTRHHTGSYYCRSTIGVSKTMLSKTITLTVHSPPVVRMTPNVETLVVTEGNHVQLKCEVLHGNPLPQLTWTDSNGEELKAMGNALTFSSVNRRNAKTYTCTVKNYLATVVNNITLIVQYRPTVNLLLPKTTCEVRTLTIACHTDGVPTVNVKLFFNNSLLSEGIGFVQHETSKISPNLFGKYSCLASNILGSQTVTKILVKSNCNSSNNQNGLTKIGADGSKFKITTYVFAAVSFIMLVAVIAFAFKLRRKLPKIGTNVTRNENTFEIAAESFTELQNTTKREQPYQTVSPANTIRPRESSDLYLEPIADSRIDRNRTYEIVE